MYTFDINLPQVSSAANYTFIFEGDDSDDGTVLDIDNMNLYGGCCTTPSSNTTTQYEWRRNGSIVSTNQNYTITQTGNIYATGHRL